MKRMPVLFAAHGSPMNALAKTSFTEMLGNLGKKLPKPQAILCISAHWETAGTQILYSAEPQTIHDFYGFPKALFDVQYPARGSLTLAKTIKELLPKAALNDKWGLDHGTWSVLVHMYPHAEIPVIQLSIDAKASYKDHLEIAAKISTLRDQGILIMGSGNIVHNLRMVQWRNPNAQYDWAIEFDEGIKKALLQRDEKTLVQFLEKFNSAAELSVPTPEHYIPLLYTYGATNEKDKLSFPFEGFEMGSLSMRSVLWE